MFDSPFQVPFTALPDTLAVFPLTGTTLLPGQQLPLNIFEPRYLAMTLDALKADRLIGMVQPRGADDAGVPALYQTGCAGRISTFQEADGGRLIVILNGVCRFRVESELETLRGYRRVRPDWSAFAHDMRDIDGIDESLETLRGPLEAYAATNQIDLPWESLETLEIGTIVDLVSMQFPFEAQLKQALLEASDQFERLGMLRVALAMDDVAGSDVARH
jgi:hypothetical protein